MIASLASLLAPRLGAKVARWAAWAIVIALLLAVLGVGKCTYDRSVVAKHEAKVSGKALAVDAAAKDEAAAQRAADTIAIDQAEKERKDAIAQGPAGRPDDARNRLNCQRLRRSGIDTAAFAECR